mgnify:CR=1 FL=1
MHTELALFGVTGIGDDELPAIAGSLPEGATIVPDFVSSIQERALIRVLDDPSTASWRSDLKRRVQHYGYRYDYRAKGVSDAARLGPLPDWAMPLCQQMVEEEYFRELPDQVIVNEYLPGQGIAPHVDQPNCFGPVVASLSLGSDTVMRFSRDDDIQGEVLLPNRSLIILQRAARYDFKHSIPQRRKDSINGQTSTRHRRISLTFRTVLSRHRP